MTTAAPADRRTRRRVLSLLAATSAVAAGLGRQLLRPRGVTTTCRPPRRAEGA